ncbi:hypothetical protein MPER_00938, partial [Moniliophthora perniciosa FA553]
DDLFRVELGVYTVIKGWEEGRIHSTYQPTYAQDLASVLRPFKGEKAILTISPDLVVSKTELPVLLMYGSHVARHMVIVVCHR